jgi:protein SCO1/2
MIPDWVARLPAINASLNSLATVLLVTGYILIKRGHRTQHAVAMVAAFVTSVAFLACYLIYHNELYRYTGKRGREFHGTGLIQPIYYSILISHVTLAVPVAIMALMTLWRAWRKKWEQHRRLARITFPIWVYVSVTGVIIYGLLYHWPVAPGV